MEKPRKVRIITSKNDKPVKHEITYERISVEINTLDDLIKLGKSYRPRRKKRYNIDLERLNRLVDPLTELNELIGLTKVKEHIINQILYFLQNLHDGKIDMLHTVIQGNPGVGKTVLGRILGKIYARMGVLDNESFYIAKRHDLIGQYLGQTTEKTQRVINRSQGGVLFIDEAYALGDRENRDSYSKECLDVLNQSLSENKERFMCIIAGYEKDLKECFFAVNPGLERRFNYTFTIDSYSPEELRLIFLKLVKDCDWSIKDDTSIPLEFFKKNSFKNQGGDMETLLVNVKMAHSRRVFCLEPEEKKVITNEDLINGYSLMNKNKEKDKKPEINPSIAHLYL